MIVRSERVVLRDGMRPAAIHIIDGRIAGITAPGVPGTSPGERVLDVGASIVLPGLVDTHVHVNEPGRTGWEGFETATRAAAAGGVTTIVDMPLNCVPPTTSLAGLEAKRRAAGGQCHVDVAFWGGVVPGNVADLESLARAGVRGFKCFLSPSGVDEFAHVDEADLRRALPVVARRGLPLLAHAEWPAALQVPDGHHRHYCTWLDSRPPRAEVEAITLLVRLSREFGARVHIVHLATGDALPLLRAARAEGVAVTVETCPHYLAFAAADIAAGDTRFKCAPPIREGAERARLWEGLLAGDIDLVASDHSPAPPAMKHLDDGDFVAAWGGIASLQLGLSAVWTAAADARSAVAHGRGAHEMPLPPHRLAQWLAESPARLAGLYPQKGVIARGADADLIVWDPDAAFVVDGGSLYHRHPVTPYHGQRLRGRVRTTILRGTVVFDDGECCGPASGRLL